jgi:hypothetical protein
MSVREHPVQLTVPPYRQGLHFVLVLRNLVLKVLMTQQRVIHPPPGGGEGGGTPALRRRESASTRQHSYIGSYECLTFWFHSAWHWPIASYLCEQFEILDKNWKWISRFTRNCNEISSLCFHHTSLWNCTLPQLCLAFKRRTFETAVARAGRSLFKCPLLLCQFLLEHFLWWRLNARVLEYVYFGHFNLTFQWTNVCTSTAKA